MLAKNGETKISKKESTNIYWNYFELVFTEYKYVSTDVDYVTFDKLDGLK